MHLYLCRRNELLIKFHSTAAHGDAPWFDLACEIFHRFSDIYSMCRCNGHVYCVVILNNVSSLTLQLTLRPKWVILAFLTRDAMPVSLVTSPY